MKSQGFTLVELAIVLMIIGLLIGGILRGQELLGNARVTSTIQQVSSYIGATHTFRDTYNATPGDMIDAKIRLPNAGSNGQLKNGDGNSIIGVQHSASSQLDEPWATVDTAMTTENAQYWKHLSQAHLISGIDPGATSPEWGKSNPKAKLGDAGFFMRWSSCSNPVGCGGGTSNHYLVLFKNINGVANCLQNSGCAVAPIRAAQMDRKMDDGFAVNGDVIAISFSWANGCGDPNVGIGQATKNGANGYDESKYVPACDMMFKVPM